MSAFIPFWAICREIALNAISLFSGIGGMDEGLRHAGFRHVLFCEADAYRRAILAERFPGVAVAADVRSLGRDQLSRIRDGREPDTTDRKRDECDGAVGLLCGGFPCQDLSVAGRRAGLAGERSGLFFEFARVAELVRPRWLLVENVPGLLSSNGGRDFGVVLATLADLGYGLAWRILDSRFFGVPQRRRRVFIAGVLADGDPRAAAERAASVLAVGTRCRRHPAAGGEAGTGTAIASLSGLGSGGPDDNDGQGGRLPLHRTKDGMIAPTLTAPERQDGGRTDKVPVIAAPLSHGSNPHSNMAGRRREDDENLVIAGPLGGGNDGVGRRSEDDPNLVTAFSWQQGDDSKWTGTGRGRSWVARAGDYAAGLSASGRHDAIHKGATVRRLTPVECERLQGFPDGWTDVEWQGKPAADSRRYAALGDAVTVPVAQFIGERIARAAA